MEDCIKDIRNWLIEGRLLLNDDKTEFLVIGTRQQLNELSPSVLHVGDLMIDPSVNVRNLGTILDNSISMDTHINQVRKTAFYHIHNIRRISKYQRVLIRKEARCFKRNEKIVTLNNYFIHPCPCFHLILKKIQSSASPQGLLCFQNGGPDEETPGQSC